MLTIEPFPDLDEMLENIGEAGERVCNIGASEGAAGNISACMGWEIEPRRRFPVMQEIVLPDAVPGLAGYSVLVTGSGRRLREVIKDPTANLGFLKIMEGGKIGLLFTSPRKLYTNLTSELNSHLAIHENEVLRSHTNFHAVVHAQPQYITYLSHIPAYQDEMYLNRRLLRWQPEAIINLPEGVGLVPFHVPSSPELMAGTQASLLKHRVIVWSKHGVVARSDISVKRATDRIEYAETAARYEYLDLANHSLAQGLTVEEIRDICATFNITQNIF